MFCEGKGRCYDRLGSCTCDVDWYLADCSGGYGDRIKAKSLVSKLMKLILQSEQKLYLGSLLIESPIGFDSMLELSDKEVKQFLEMFDSIP